MNLLFPEDKKRKGYPQIKRKTIPKQAHWYIQTAWQQQKKMQRNLKGIFPKKVRKKGKGSEIEAVIQDGGHQKLTAE